MGTALLTLENPLFTPWPARSVRYMGSLFTFHEDSSTTGGRLALLEVEAKPGMEPPRHVHHNEDEVFYVLAGTLRVFRGDEEFVVNAGESAFLPRSVPHTFKILSSYVHGLVYVTPGGFEGYFRELGTPVNGHQNGVAERPLDVAEMSRVASRYGIEFLPE